MALAASDAAFNQLAGWQHPSSRMKSSALLPGCQRTQLPTINRSALSVQQIEVIRNDLTAMGGRCAPPLQAFVDKC